MGAAFIYINDLPPSFIRAQPYGMFITCASIPRASLFMAPELTFKSEDKNDAQFMACQVKRSWSTWERGKSEGEIMV